MSHVFVSYKSEDKDFVFREVVRLQRIYRVWWDKTSIVGGADWEKAIRAGLDESAALIVILSPRAIESSYVRFEYETALAKGIPVIPVMIEPCDIPAPLRHIQVIMTSNPAWYGQLTEALQGAPNIETAAIHDDHARIQDIIGNPSVTFEDAAAQFKGVLRFDPHELNLIGLPMLVTPYTMTYLVGQAADSLKRHAEIQVALQLSQGLNDANFPVQVAKYAQSQGMRLQMILVRGPMSLTQHPQFGISMVHGLDNANHDEWRDVVSAAYTSIHRYHQGTTRPEMIHVFNLAPAALMGAFGVRAARGMGITFYNFGGPAKYHPVYTQPVE